MNERQKGMLRAALHGAVCPSKEPRDLGAAEGLFRRGLLDKARGTNGVRVFELTEAGRLVAIELDNALRRELGLEAFEAWQARQAEK